MANLTVSTDVFAALSAADNAGLRGSINVPSVQEVGTRKAITIPGHSFMPTNALRDTGGTWTGAQANLHANAIGVWIVESVDGDDLIIRRTGEMDITGLGLLANTTYCLSETTQGGITAAAPLSPNVVITLFSTNGDATVATLDIGNPSDSNLIRFADVVASEFKSGILNNTDFAAALVSVLGVPLVGQVLRHSATDPKGFSWGYPPDVATEAPGAPVAPTLLSKTHDTIEVETSPVSGAAGYQWRMDGVDEGEPTSEPTKIFTERDSETEYSITVAAVNGFGSSAFSTALVVTTDAVPDTDAPGVVSATIDATGLILTIVLDEAASVPDSGDFETFTLSTTGSTGVTAEYSSGEGTDTLVFGLSREVKDNENLTLTNSPTGNSWEDAAENEMGAFSGFTVDNQSAVSGATYPMDLISGTPIGYSMERKLRSAYSGNAIKVRRADGELMDVPILPNGRVDRASWAAWNAGQDGFLHTAYDHGTGGRNLVQATDSNQPKVFDASTGVLKGANECIKLMLDGTDDVMTGTSTGITFPLMAYTMCAVRSTTDEDRIWALGSNRGELRINSPGNFRAYSGGPVDSGNYVLNTWYLVTTLFTGGANSEIRINKGTKVTASSGTNTPNALQLGHSTLCAAADVSEWILCPATAMTIGSTEDNAINDEIRAVYARPT